LYYLAIQRLGVSVGQLLYSLYPLFVAFWLILDRQLPSRITLMRMIIALTAVILLTITDGSQRIDPLGMVMMVIASALYALHLPINQRVLLEVPPPTVTLYTLISMSVVVVPVYLIFDRTLPAPEQHPYWLAIVGLTLVTFASRLTLFLGVKHLGELQAALLGLTELLVAIIFSHITLGESLSRYQVIGAALLALTLVLVTFDKQPPPRKRKDGWLSWIRPPMPVIPPWDSQHE
jgi:drug/metabolite transporter (DMT)-like permease